MMNPIEQFLADKPYDFAKGFNLFCKYSRNRSLMKYIGRTHNADCLFYNLRKLARQLPPKANPSAKADYLLFTKRENPPKEKTKTTTPCQPKPIDTSQRLKVDREQLPEHLRELYDHNSNDYKLKRASHEKMKQAATDEQRAELRATILQLDTEIRERWVLIDEFLQANPDKSGSKPTLNINTIRSFISKCSKATDLPESSKRLLKERVAYLQYWNIAIKPETLNKLHEKKFI